MANPADEHSSTDATARENPKLNLVERLDQLQWHLDDIEMRDVDRFEIDHFIGSLMNDVVAESARKKNKWFTRVWKRFFSKRTRNKEALPGILRMKKTKESIQAAPGILPLVVFIPPHEEIEMSTIPNIFSPRQEDTTIYYLQDDAYTPKKAPFFVPIKDDVDGEKNHGLTRTATEETIRMNASFEPDLFDKTNDDCFWELSTGI